MRACTSVFVHSQTAGCRSSSAPRQRSLSTGPFFSSAPLPTLAGHLPHPRDVHSLKPAHTGRRCILNFIDAPIESRPSEPRALFEASPLLQPPTRSELLFHKPSRGTTHRPIQSSIAGAIHGGTVDRGSRDRSIPRARAVSTSD